jgi:hypothetical protein
LFSFIFFPNIFLYFLYKGAIMAVINSVSEVLHRIRVKLYPNDIPNTEGAYIARTDNEASLSVEDVCAALKNRGGFTGNYNDMVEYVRQFFDEVTQVHDTAKHPVTFRFHTRAPLRALAEHIAVEGLADTQGYIDEFIDITTEAVNETLTPGGMFSVSGHKIKVAGDDPEMGVYFVPADGEAAVKAAGHLAKNTASKLIGVILPLGAGKWKAEVKTRFASRRYPPQGTPRYRIQGRIDGSRRRTVSGGSSKEPKALRG